MLLGHTRNPATYQLLLPHPIWRQALDWAIKNQEKSDGEYEIQGRDMFASVQTVETLPRDEAVFEAHREYIDLHSCIEGGELIEWAPVDALTPKTEFDTKNDYGLYVSPQAATRVRLTPGAFAIFLPADAHMPKIHDGTHASTKKIVVKIRANLFDVS